MTMSLGLNSLNTQCGCNNCKCDGGWLDHPTSVPFWLTEKWIRS